MAWAEIAAISALLSERHATEMGANADLDQKCFPGTAVFAHSGPVLVGCRGISREVGVSGKTVRKAVDRNRLGLFDFLLRAIADEDRFTAPLDSHRHTRREGGHIHLDLGQCERRSVRIHLIDQRPSHQGSPYGAHGSSRDKQKVAACRFFFGGISMRQDNSPLSAPRQPGPDV